jgi:hypothetical protein
VYHIFAYLNKHEKSSIVFDPTDPYFDPVAFQEVDWSEFYGDVVDELPPKMPKPLGNSVRSAMHTSTHRVEKRYGLLLVRSLGLAKAKW